MAVLLIRFSPPARSKPFYLTSFREVGGAGVQEDVACVYTIQKGQWRFQLDHTSGSYPPSSLHLKCCLIMPHIVTLFCGALVSFTRSACADRS
jgi:hypothetical protein